MELQVHRIEEEQDCIGESNDKKRRRATGWDGYHARYGDRINLNYDGDCDWPIFDGYRVTFNQDQESWTKYQAQARWIERGPRARPHPGEGPIWVVDGREVHVLLQRSTEAVWWRGAAG